MARLQVTTVAEQWQGITQRSPGIGAASNTCLVSERFYRQICTKLSKHRILDKQNIFGHPCHQKCPKSEYCCSHPKLSQGGFGVVMVTPQPHNLPVCRKLLIENFCFAPKHSSILERRPAVAAEAAAKQLKCWVNKVFAKLQYSASPVTLFMNTDGGCRPVFARIHILLCPDNTHTALPENTHCSDLHCKSKWHRNEVLKNISSHLTEHCRQIDVE